VNLLQPRGNDLLVREIDVLREAVRHVRQRHRFRIGAWIVLPDHLHCIWTLPPGDSGFSTLWRLLEREVSRNWPRTEHLSEVRRNAGELGIWQRRYREHLIRDDGDLERDVNYVHVSPLKHGWVERVSDWSCSTFHRYVERGIYAKSRSLRV
jgi:putative transposase